MKIVYINFNYKLKMFFIYFASFPLKSHCNDEVFNFDFKRDLSGFS